MTAATEPRTEPQAPQTPAGLATKLVQASLAVENVPKSGKNTQQNYDYAKAEDVADKATKALLAVGVLSEFECLESTAHPIKSRQGSDGLIVTVRCRLVVTDSESGETATRMAMGSGSDYPGDKAIYKAQTGARKYAFIHLLGIPIGDDPDAHRGEANGSRRAAAPKLEAKRVEKIIGQFKERSMKFREIGLALGAAGIDGLRANSAKAVRERVESLSEEEADALEKVLGDAS